MSKYDALILAGGESPWLEALGGTKYRCLAKINNRYALDYLLEALQQCGYIRKIAIVAAPGAIAQLQTIVPKDIVICEAAENLPATAYAGIKALGSDCSDMVLGICDDIPMVTAEALKDFIEQCEAERGKDVYYPLIAKQTCEAQFPGAQRTYGRLIEGEFTGGNMMFIAKDAVIRCQAVGKQIYGMRKSPYKLASWLGWSFIFKALLHRLGIADVEKRYAELAAMPCKAIITKYASIGMDIDKPDDLKQAEAYLKSLKETV